jgi:hypothetical protein
MGITIITVKKNIRTITRTILRMDPHYPPVNG